MLPNLLRQLDFSRRGMARVFAVTVAGTLITLVFSLVTVSYTTGFIDSPLARGLSWAAAIVLPFLMSAPVFYFFASKLRELAIAHGELAEIASRDSLTTCLNRGAFITLVDAYLAQVNAARPTWGALLMVDADHFKAVNDQFGHASGDEALRLIADQIKAALRVNDLVGRVGGEEFAVFLPHTDHANAQLVAERIRVKVSSTRMVVDGQIVPLSVSVGGVDFVKPISFEELFRKADAMLYQAKRLGRNRVELATAAI